MGFSSFSAVAGSELKANWVQIPTVRVRRVCHLGVQGKSVSVINQLKQGKNSVGLGDFEWLSMALLDVQSDVRVTSDIFSAHVRHQVDVHCVEYKALSFQRTQRKEAMVLTPV